MVLRAKAFFPSIWFKLIIISLAIVLIFLYQNSRNFGLLISTAFMAVYWLIQFLLKREYKRMCIYMPVIIAMIIIQIVFLL